MTTDILSIVRALVGRRSRITRRQMADILIEATATGLSLANDCNPDSVTWERAPGGLGYRPAAVQDHGRAAVTWANLCSGRAAISVLADGCTPHGAVRYDSPGSLHPMHQCPVMFAAASVRGHDHLRDHCTRLLIVADSEPLVVPPTAEQRAVREREDARHRQRLARLREAVGADGVYVRILDDAVLELRDPNSGQSADDPDGKPRYQYRMHNGLQRRYLPPVSAGDQWRDGNAHLWTDYDGYDDDGPVGAYYEQHA